MKTFTIHSLQFRSRVALALVLSGLAGSTGATTRGDHIDPATQVSPHLHQYQTEGWNNLVLTQYESSIDLGSLANSDLQETMSQPQYVEVRANHDGEALTQDILPQVMTELGYDELTIPNQRLLSGTLPSVVTALLACHSTSSVWELNMNSIDVSLPLDSNDVIASFREGGRINTDLDVDDLSLEFEMQFYYPKNSSAYCNLFGTTYNIKVDVNVDGLSGEFDVQTDAVSKQTFITDIKKVEFDVDSVSFDSGFLTTLTNIGISVANLFGTGCSSLTACVNDAIDAELTSNVELQNQIKDALNDALAHTLAVDGGFNIGTADVDYSVGLEDLTSSNSLDRLTSVWDVAFESDQADDACADDLNMTAFFPGNGITTDNDLEIVVPFKKITDLLYVIGKKGALCANASVPGTPLGNANLSVAPTGAFDVESVEDNVLKLSLPMAASVNISNASGDIGAALALTVELTPACGSGLSLNVTDVAFEDVSGLIEWDVLGQHIEIDATAFVVDLADDLADDIENTLDDRIDVLPESFGLAEVARYVATGDIVSNGSAIALGVNVVDYDPNCN